MLKVGLIGCGGIGAIHARCWLNMEHEVHLAAIADTNTERAEKYASKTGTKIYKSADELIKNEKLDIVDICLPTFLHAKYALMAMDYVPNIIIEKPICLKEEEALILEQKQKETGALVQVAHVVRFMYPYQYLKEIVDQKIYGKIIAGSFHRISPRPMWMQGHDDPNRTGTMAVDMHIHDVDFIRHLMNCEADHIDSWAVKDNNGIIQHIWSAYHYGNAVLTAEGSWDYPVSLAFEQSFRVRLENAAIKLEKDGSLTVYTNDGDVITPNIGDSQHMDLGINVTDIAPYMNEIKYFLENIKNNNNNGIASLKNAIASLRVVLKECFD